MFWIRACMQCVWTGSIEIKLSTDIISWYFGTYNVRQRYRRACASLHSQFSIDGSGMSSITAFMLNGLILCVTIQTTTWKRALLYISLYKQTNLASLLLFNAAVCKAFFKVVTSTVTCKCSILTTRQRMTLVLHGEHKLRWAFSRGKCNSYSLPEACLFNVCDHVKDHCWRIPMHQMLLIGKHFANEEF